MKLNLALNLPAGAKARDIELSRQLAEQHDAYFVLGEDTNYPHLTVYAAEFSEDAVGPVLEAAERLAAEAQPIVCAATRVEAHQGYVGVEVVISSAIMRFHEHVVHTLAPLRAEQHSGGADYGMTFTPEMISNMEQYGYADALQLYTPHFTIIRLKDERLAEKVAASIQWDIPEFTADSIGVYRMGEHGTCQELLREFAFR